MPTRFVPTTGVLLALVAAGQLAGQVPAPELQIAGAVSAAPAALRSDATVLGYPNYHRMATLRDGMRFRLDVSPWPLTS